MAEYYFVFAIFNFRQEILFCKFYASFLPANKKSVDAVRLILFKIRFKLP